MQRYFFDINDGRNRIPDTEGQELPTRTVAQKLAIEELALITRDEMPDGPRESYVVTVRDESGRPIYVAAAMLLAEALAGMVIRARLERTLPGPEVIALPGTSGGKTGFRIVSRSLGGQRDGTGSSEAYRGTCAPPVGR